ncbi:hypothetical protein [Undibacterium sp. Ji22W]|uniref:hypothetical protein n=1 Tax=Undibacterium sp. Ji22W TaxID=3413038 RepID=UPI003BEFED8F
MNAKLDSDRQYPSVARRVLCALGYACGAFAGISLLGALLVSVDCQLDAKCSTRDSVIDTALSGVWILATITCAYKAWRAELPGCRKPAPQAN